jgi:hypothetical protein
MDKQETQEIACEFFGITLKTKNPNIARLLMSDAKDFLDKDITHIPAFAKARPARRASAYHSGDRSIEFALIP